MKDLIKELMRNQIALALILFTVIVAGAYWRLGAPEAKEIVIQVITATGALVTGYAMGVEKNKRSTDTTDTNTTIKSETTTTEGGTP